MDPELMALASSGAATLVGLMISDSWTQVKEGIARMLARGKAVKETAQELDASRDELLAASASDDQLTVTSIEGEWRSRLSRLLEADPALADDLQRFMKASSARSLAGPTGDVHNVISGGVQHGPVIQAGRISGLAMHGPGPSSPSNDHD
ncbi:hypothetical protein [Microtetraspora glauca]|uniref:Uncharacterized protein n=1 Tax=Microtetraspora glauca TaxID=1996 RepID=A0ABV3GTY3_MICGL